MKQFQEIILNSAKEGITDIHLTGNHPLVFRQNGNIKFQYEIVVKPDELDSLVHKLLTTAQLRILQTKHSVDIALSIKHVRLRINIFDTWRGVSLALRILPGIIPSLDMLNLLPVFDDIINMREGLVLFCGPTGSGKTTTISGIINEINKQRATHIVTLEDPIEYRFPSGKSFIQQREYGTHFTSFTQGLTDVLREDPDVIFVGELRSPETMRLALDGAESGHLVISTMHSSTPEETILRFINSFDSTSQEFARSQLATALQAIVVQRLVYEPELDFRIPILSILRTNAAIRTLMRENKTSQLQSVLQLHTTKNMHTMETYRAQLFKQVSHFHRPEESLRPSNEIISDECVTSSIFLNEDNSLSLPSQTNTSPKSTDNEFDLYIKELDSSEAQPH